VRLVDMILSRRSHTQRARGKEVVAAEASRVGPSMLSPQRSCKTGAHAGKQPAVSDPAPRRRSAKSRVLDATSQQGVKPLSGH